MRVIAGSARGRTFVAPRGTAVRPTADRVREAMFSSLGDAVIGARVLDCYAGSGALAIESLSRGAAAAVLVERHDATARCVQQNLERLGFEATVHRGDAAVFALDPVGGPFDLVFCDPPYAVEIAEIHALLQVLEAAGALSPRLRVVVERERRAPDLDRPPPGFLASARSRAYGDTVLCYYHRKEEPGQ